MQLALLAAVVLRLSHIEPQNVQELATVVRSTADIRELTVNADERSVTFNGTPQQNAIAEWLVPQLDVTGRRPIVAPYKVSADDVVHVFYPTQAETPQHIIELATGVRSLAQIPRAFVYQPSKGIVVRGNADQIALFEWLAPRLDVREPQPDSPRHQVGSKADDIARVFYLTHARSVQEVQELSTVVRTIGEIRQSFTYNPAKAVALRGTEDQMEIAEFLIGKLNRPAGASPMADEEHRISGTPDGVVRLFVLKQTTMADLQQQAKNIREATGIRRAVVYMPHRALILRGAPEQIVEAARLVNAN